MTQHDVPRRLRLEGMGMDMGLGMVVLPSHRRRLGPKSGRFGLHNIACRNRQQLAGEQVKNESNLLAAIQHGVRFVRCGVYIARSLISAQPLGN